METIRMLKIEPLKAPVLIEVEHTLETLQELVGGTIQAVYPWEDPVALLCDDDGKGKGYTPNRVLVGEDGEPYDLVVGTFYICGLTRDDFGSLSDELAEKYTELFRCPEMLMKTLDGGILWFRLGSGENPRMIG
jgi:hypothetical protein